MSRNIDDILNKAFEVLKKYPLCDRCLGRLFAKYGLGLSNAERGRALKTLIAMEIHRKALNSRSLDEVKEELLTIASNSGEPVTTVARNLIGEVKVNKCVVCEDSLNHLIGELTVKVVEALKEYSITSFLIGVEKNSNIELKEKHVFEGLGIDTWENIRREIRREVGKRVQGLLNIPPDFKKPDVVAIINLDKNSVKVVVKPVYIYGRYLKLGRNISQRWWFTREGTKRYPLSIEGVAEKVRTLFKADGINIHAAGREDVDVRMIGNGRPIVIEVLNPKIRGVNLNIVNETLKEEPWVSIKTEEYADLPLVREIKQSKKPKTYRAIIYSDKPFTNEDLLRIFTALNNCEIKQRTPKRILKRKKDVLRTRKVYSVNGKLLNEHVAELILKCESGLYVKELMTGDEGRTTPSVASLLGREVSVLFLDVLDYPPT